MTLPREDPPASAAGPVPVAPVRAAPASPGAQNSAAAIHIEDQLQSRVRIPADLLRCVIALIEIALLAALALLARATANGAETDIVLARRIREKVILPLDGALNVPNAAVIASAQASLISMQGDVQARVTDVQEYLDKVNTFVQIAAIVLSMAGGMAAPAYQPRVA